MGSLKDPRSGDGAAAPVRSHYYGRLNPDVLSSLPDNELMAQLTAIPGIGPWTVQGALIIALQREDVVLPGDLALRRRSSSPISSTTSPPSRRSSPSLRSGDLPQPATSYLFSAAFESAEARPVTSHET